MSPWDGTTITILMTLHDGIGGSGVSQGHGMALHKQRGSDGLGIAMVLAGIIFLKD